MTLAFRASWCQDLFFQVTSSIQSTAPSDVLSPESVSILKMHLIIKKKVFVFVFCFLEVFLLKLLKWLQTGKMLLLVILFPVFGWIQKFSHWKYLYLIVKLQCSVFLIVNSILS